MYSHVCILTYVYSLMYTNVCILIYTYSCIHTYVYIHVYVYSYMYTYVCILMYTYLCIHTHVYILMYVYPRMYTYVCILLIRLTYELIISICILTFLFFVFPFIFFHTGRRHLFGCAAPHGRQHCQQYTSSSMSH
jgi:hypothetical protein